MRFLCLIFLAVTCGAAGQPTAGSEESHPVTDFYILRTGEQIQAPHIVTYRVAEWAQQRGRWILPDFGYYDTGYGKDQLWFTGAGADLTRSKHFDWEQEIYFAQEAGPESTNKRSLWIWPVFDVRFRPRLTGEFVPYPTIPLDRAEKAGFAVDRAKIEYAATYHWKAGLGYAGCSEAGGWKNSPFLTTSRATRVGKFEFWLERISGGAQVQLRYMLVRSEH